MVKEYAAEAVAKRDVYLEAYFREKIRETVLPEPGLGEFSDDEIEALRLIACKSAVQLDRYGGDLISLATPELERRRSESLKCVDQVECAELLIDNPWSVFEEHPQFMTCIARINRKDPRGKIDYPYVWATWWEPMSVNDYVWATATYPAKIRKFLKTFGAVPLNLSKGSLPARHPVETNLIVMKKWLDEWENPSRRVEVCGHLKEHLESTKRDLVNASRRKSSELVKFLSRNKPSNSLQKLPFEDEILDLISRYCDV